MKENKPNNHQSPISTRIYNCALCETTDKSRVIAYYCLLFFEKNCVKSKYRSESLTDNAKLRKHTLGAKTKKSNTRRFFVRPSVKRLLELSRNSPPPPLDHQIWHTRATLRDAFRHGRGKCETVVLFVTCIIYGRVRTYTPRGTAWKHNFYSFFFFFRNLCHADDWPGPGTCKPTCKLNALLQYSRTIDATAINHYYDILYYIYRVIVVIIFPRFVFPLFKSQTSVCRPPHGGDTPKRSVRNFARTVGIYMRAIFNKRLICEREPARLFVIPPLWVPTWRFWRFHLASIACTVPLHASTSLQTCLHTRQTVSRPYVVLATRRRCSQYCFSPTIKL